MTLLVQRAFLRSRILLWLLLAIVPGYNRLIAQPARWTASPLAFVDMGPAISGDVAFSERGNGCMLLLQRDGPPLRSPAGSVGLKFLGANRNPEIKGSMQQSGHSNYLFGNDPSKIGRASCRERV